LARILLLSPYEPPSDGIARHSAHLVDAWDSAGHSVLVISPATKRGLNTSEVIGSRSKVSRIMRKTPRRSVSNEALSFDPDIVVVQFSIATFNVDLWSVTNLSKRFGAARVPVVVAFQHANMTCSDLSLALSIDRSFESLTCPSSSPARGDKHWSRTNSSTK